MTTFAMFPYDSCVTPTESELRMRRHWICRVRVLTRATDQAQYGLTQLDGLMSSARHDDNAYPPGRKGGHDLNREAGRPSADFAH
jgi:hypothetical protein